jgi:hypothetical protein
MELLKDRKKVILIIGIILGIILILVGIWAWASFVYYKNCDTKDCFDNSLLGCSRAQYLNTGNMTFLYSINGKSNGLCVVQVELVQGDLNNQDSLKLEKKEMKCYLPLNTIMIPESDINNCHGLLKEGLQDIFISRLHSYLVQNLGRINLEYFQNTTK